MHIEKYIQKYSQPNQKLSHAVEAKINHLSSPHQYLNFVKKNANLIELEKNRLKYQSPFQIARNNSVFITKDQEHYKTQKLTISINATSSKQANSEQLFTAKKLYEIVQRKNQQIQQSINKQRQSMSDIVYNYSKFRAMEQNYYRNDKIQKTKRKQDKIKQLDSVKFPLIPKNHQEVFTIEYDAQGRKIVRVKLIQSTQSPDKKKSQSLVNDKQKHFQGQLIKKDLNFFKRRKHQNQFGIQIKSISNQITQNAIQAQKNSLKKQSYQVSPQKTLRKSKIVGKKRQNNETLQAPHQIEEQIQEENEDCGYMRKQYISSQNFHYSQDSKIQHTFVKHRPKFSVLSMDRNESVSKIDEQLEIDDCQRQQCDIIYFKKEKSTDAIVKKQKKSMLMISSDKQLTKYDQKINSFRQFLFMINFAHFKFDHLQLKQTGSLKNQEKYKYYIGKGNNSLLVQSIFKRRFWWVQQDDYKKTNLAWTQLKIGQFFQTQNKSDNKYQQKKLQSQSKTQKKKKLIKNHSQMRPKVGYKAPLPAQKDRILTTYDRANFQLYQNSVSSNQMAQRMLKYANRLKFFEPNYLQPCKEDKSNEKMHNHLQFNHFIGNKKALFYNLKQYYQLQNKNVFQIIPLTYHIKQGSNDPQYLKFTKQFKKIQNQKYKNKQSKQQEGKPKIKNVWIVKPGELSNRGNGIVVINQIYQLNNIFKKKQKHNDGNDKTYIVQKYIQRPLLYKGRKFDIRHYMVITKLYGLMRAYWYGEGYIRTSSYDFDLDDIGDQMIHLTNDAIQKNCTFYGKHQEGNKLSYFQFQKYMDQKVGQGKFSFVDQIYPKMKSIATDAVKSTFLQLDTQNLQHNFEIFGLDFMIDENLNVWLIEVNTNPCLEISSKLLGRIIPNMLEHAFRLSVDVIFPPPCHYPNSQKYLTPDHPLGRLNYELIFDEARDSKQLIQLYKNVKEIDYGGQIKEDNQVYENEGKQLQLLPDLN